MRYRNYLKIEIALITSNLFYSEIRHANVRRQAPQRGGSGKSGFARSSSGRTTNSSNFF